MARCLAGLRGRSLAGLLHVTFRNIQQGSRRIQRRDPKRYNTIYRPTGRSLVSAPAVDGGECGDREYGTVDHHLLCGAAAPERPCVRPAAGDPDGVEHSLLFDFFLPVFSGGCRAATHPSPDSRLAVVEPLPLRRPRHLRLAFVRAVRPLPVFLDSALLLPKTLPAARARVYRDRYRFLGSLDIDLPSACRCAHLWAGGPCTGHVSLADGGCAAAGCRPSAAWRRVSEVAWEKGWSERRGWRASAER